MAITDNLLWFLDLDDDAADDSVNGMAFTNVGGVTFGGTGNGASFNGSSQDLVLVPTVNSTTTFTWAGWIKPSSVTGYAALFAAANAFQVLYLHAGKLDYYNGSTEQQSGGAVTINVWSHVAVVVSGGNLTLYINGSADGTGTSIPTMIIKTIGWDDFPGEYFPGQMRCMGMWSTALSAGNITTLYNAGTALTFAGMGGVVGGGTAVADPTVITGCKLWQKSDTGVYKDAGSTPSAHGDKILQWNDQSGNSNHLTHADDADVGKYYSVSSDKRVIFSPESASTRMLFPPLYSINKLASTQFYVFHLNDTGQTQIPLDIFTSPATGNYETQISKGIIVGKAGSFVPSRKVCVVQVNNGNYQRTYVNTVESALATTVLATGSSADAAIGNLNGGVLEFVNYDNAISQQNVDKLLAYARARYSLQTAYNFRVLFVGDSLTQGVGATLRQSYPGMMALPETDQWFNFGITGSFIADKVTEKAAEVDPLLDATKGYVFVYIGTNDSAFGRTAAEIFADLKSYCQSLKTDGWHKVIVFSYHTNVAALNTVSTDLAGDFTVATTHARLWGPAGGITYADYLYDLHNQPLIGEVSGTQGDYLVDGTHFNDAGYTILAAEVASYFPELFPPTAGTLSQSSVGSTTASLSYATVSGGTSPYSNQLRRSLVSGSGYSNVGSPQVGATASFSDTGLTASTDYYYVVVTTDDASQTATSNEVHVTTSAAAVAAGHQSVHIGIGISI